MSADQTPPEPLRTPTSWPDVAVIAVVIFGIVALCALCVLTPVIR